MEHELTTPFGARAMTLGMAAVQIASREKLKEQGTSNRNGSPGSQDGDHLVHKWQVLSDITEAKEEIGLTDRTLAVLSALLSFHQEITLGSGSLIVFPSNEKLSQRAHGMSPATLRRHLACLIAADVIIRRDSPNGKRYARFDRQGEVSQAYGFDLSPLVVRAEEFACLAEDARERKKAMKLVREKITLVRRDILKNLALVQDEGLPGDWDDLYSYFIMLTSRIRPTSGQEELEGYFEQFRDMATSLAKTIENHIKTLKMSGNESHNERHKQYQTQPQDSDINGYSVIQGDFDEDPSSQIPEKRHRLKGFTLSFVLETCPDILDYSLYEVRSWNDFMQTAGLLRSLLGISPDAWEEACRTIGELEASVIIACLLQKGQEIKSAGGYLRALTRKASEGQFSVGPLLMSIAKKKLDAKQGKSA